jgi:hypothetical protein
MYIYVAPIWGVSLQFASQFLVSDVFSFKVPGCSAFRKKNGMQHLNKNLSEILHYMEKQADYFPNQQRIVNSICLY